MPNIKSAKKRVKVTKTKTLKNRMFKTMFKTTLKKFEAAIVAGDKAAAEAAYKEAVKKVDKAAAKNLIHKSAAARKKSQMTMQRIRCAVESTSPKMRQRTGCNAATIRMLAGIDNVAAQIVKLLNILFR